MLFFLFLLNYMIFKIFFFASKPQIMLWKVIKKKAHSIKETRKMKMTHQNAGNAFESLSDE